MSFDDTLRNESDKVHKEEADNLQKEADYEDHHSARARFFEATSAFGHKVATTSRASMRALGAAAPAAGQGGGDPAFAQDLEKAAGHLVQKPMQAYGTAQAATGDPSYPKAVGGLAKGIGSTAKEMTVGGPGATYAKGMMGDTPEGVRQSMPQPLKSGTEIGQDVWGGLTNAVIWGTGFGEIKEGLALGLGRTLKPWARTIPEKLIPILSSAMTGGGLSGGTEALDQRLKSEKSHDIGTNVAFGALLGGLAGLHEPADAKAVQENAEVLRTAAGGAYGQSVKQLMRVGRMIGGREWSPEESTQKLAKLAMGSGDQAVAAKVRLLHRSDPDLFKDPLMKRILNASNRDDAGEGEPAVERPKPGSIARIFNYPQQTSEVVTQKDAGAPSGAKRGPLGIPLSDERETVAAYATKEKKWADDLVAARKAGDSKKVAALEKQRGNLMKERAALGEPETVRFYHGGGDTKGGKRWLTPDKKYAEGYAAKTKGAKVSFVDIDKNDPQLKKSFDDSGTNMKSPYAAFEADENLTARLQPISTAPPPQGEGERSLASLAPKTATPANKAAGLIGKGAASDPSKVPDVWKKAATADGQADIIKGLMSHKPYKAPTPEWTAARRAVSELVMNGSLKPENVTVGPHARRVSMALAQTAEELRKSEGAGFKAHLDAARKWAGRASALDAPHEITAKKIDATSPSEIQELRQELDQGRQVETNASGPAPKAITKAMHERKKSGKPHC